MSNQIDKTHVQQYENNLIILAQQEGSALRNTVQVKTLDAKSGHFDRLGSQVAVRKTSRHMATPQNDTPHSRRRVILEDFVTNDYVDNTDLMRALIDPRSAYAQVQAFALGRQMDQIIIEAATGNATSVDATDATSNVAVAHTIDEDFSTANSDIVLEKMIEAQRILMTNNVNMREERFFVMDSTALHNMLNETKVQSADYNTIRSLVSGKLETFLGFKIIVTEELNSSSEGFKNCLAYTKSAIGLAVGQDIKVRMSERPDLSYSHQIFAEMSAGAVRVEEEKLVVIEAYRA